MDYQQGQQPRFLEGEAPNPRRMMSEQTAEAIDNEVKHIIDTAHQKALDILTCNRDLLDTFSTQLLETEVIEGDKLPDLLNQVKPVIEYGNARAAV